MPRTKQVSEKNTKNEILAAYQELLSEVSVGGSPTMQEQEEKAVVTAASNKTVEKITDDLSKLKLSFAAAVNDLTDRLTQEAETLATIQKAIVISKKELDETQKIKVTTGLLYRLLEAQKQQEEAFEKNMQEKKRAWVEEEKMHAEEIARSRSHEEEEYAYEKKLMKGRDVDERESEKIARERKIAEEASTKAAMVKELEDLRKKVAQAPQETERAVKEAVTREVADTIKEADMVLNQTKQIAELKILSLETVNKIQANEILQFKKQLEEATRQVKDIAVSVIESKRSESPQAQTVK